MRKTRKPKILWGRVFDVILLFIYTIIATLACLVLFNFTNKYAFILAGILMVIFFIYFFSYKVKVKWINFLKRALMILLCAFLFVGFNFANTIHQSTMAFNDRKESTITMLVLTLNDNNIEDLDGQVVGYENNKNNKSFAKKSLSKLNNIADEDAISFKSKGYSKVIDLISDLYNGQLGAIIINKDDLSIIPDSFGDVLNNTKTLKSFKYKKVVHNPKENNIAVNDEVFTIYLSASDQTGKPTSDSLSDMNMLVMVDPITKTINTISIPRDAYVPNPALDYQNDKLTHTGASGIENTVKAVETMFQIKIDFYAKISFDSLIKIVNELGGIETNVKIDFCEQNEYRSFDEKDLVCLKKGEQKLNGSQALAYSRHRHSYENQDLGRNQAQMQVIKGIMKKMIQTGFSKADKILKILPNYIITNFSNKQITDLIKAQIDNNTKWSFNSIQLDTGTPGDGITASYPDESLSVYYLSKNDVDTVNGLYNLIVEKPTMNKFSYDPNDEYGKFSDWTNRKMYQLADEDDTDYTNYSEDYNNEYSDDSYNNSDNYSNSSDDSNTYDNNYYDNYSTELQTPQESTYSSDGMYYQ